MTCTNESNPDESNLPQASLAASLDTYQTALDDSELLPALLARDQVEFALQQTRPIPAAPLQRLVPLDARLRDLARTASLTDLPAWRQILHPPDAAWWWTLDQEAREWEEKREGRNDLPWVLLTGVLSVLTVPLMVEILRGLWEGAPDIGSIFGTLLALLLAGSPLFDWGQELAKWMFQHIPRFEVRFRAEAMAGMAALTFVLVLAARLLQPQLALLYNNWGHAALRAGNLKAAQHNFRRAVALSPDLVVPYYNLASVYQRIGRPDEALGWYQKAIERDLNFGPAYGGLGHLYNLEGEFAQAERVLLAGLECKYDEQDAQVETVTRYVLLSNLGWAYFAQERYESARAVLEAVVAMEGELKALGASEGTEYRSALPHYYLAQVYEQLDCPQEAIQQWEDCLRLLDENDWANRDWIATAWDHLDLLESGQ